LTYRFYVKGVNFNGEEEKSSIAYLKPCNSPSGLDRPTIMDFTQTKIAKQWTAAKGDGCCQILDFRIYLDDGIGGALVMI